MFNWVVKVVPQPPGALGNLGEEEKPSQPSSAQRKKVTFQDEASKAKSKDEETSEENNVQGGMITWFSSGFAYALPQPAAAYRANTEAKEDNIVDRQGIGIIGWIVQGLGKVVPQLDDKYKEVSEPEGQTEIRDAKDVPDAEVPPVVEVQSEDEVPEVPESPPSISPGMVDWIKHGFEKIIPQPELPGPAHCPPVKVTARPPDAQKASDEETNVVGWFVKGLGRMVPQPVLRPREDTSEITVVQNICICQQPDHLVVEEVEEEVEEGGETEQPEKPLDLQGESSKPTQVLSTQQEEMETHTEATTVTLENSQEQLEAGSGEVKLDSQAEENAQPEEDQAAKLVEESGQPEEDQAAMLVEESGQPEEDQAAMLVEESGQPEEDQPAQVAEEATQASSGEQSANIQEEEMKEVSECLEDMDPAEGTPPLLVSTETEPTVPESKEAEPENSVKRDSRVLVSTSGDKPEPSVVTKQPEPTKEVHPPSPIAQDDETADEGCGVSPSCHMNIKYSRSLHYSPDNVLTVPYVPMETKSTLVTTNDEEAKQTDIDTELPEISSTASVPPPPPVHRPSPVPREIPEDDEDVVSETSDCSMVIRMAPHTHGEAVLSVELKPSDGPETQ